MLGYTRTLKDYSQIKVVLLYNLALATTFLSITSDMDLYNNKTQQATLHVP